MKACEPKNFEIGFRKCSKSKRPRRLSKGIGIIALGAKHRGNEMREMNLAMGTGLLDSSILISDFRSK